MTLSASSGHPINCGTLAGAPAWSFDKGRATDYTIAAIPQTRATSGSSSTVTVQDASYNRTTSASTITDFLVEPAFVAGNVGYPVTITSGNTGRLTNPVSGICSGVSAGAVTLTGTAAGEPDVVATVTVATTGGATVDTFQSFVSGSAAANAAAAIDSRIASASPSTAKAMFSTLDHSTPTYVRNSSCWAADLDLTCISPWSNYGVDGRTATLVSPRHVIMAAHYYAVSGTVVRFVASDGTVVSRTITATAVHPSYSPYYPDIAVGVLDSDVPGTIGFARVLPSNWATYFPTLASGTNVVPVLTTRVGKPALVSNLATLGNSFDLHKPPSGQRAAFWETIVTGDSGNPTFLVIGGQLVLIGTYTFGGSGSGTSIHAHASAVNTMMSNLGGGYSLTTVNLSGYTAY